MKTMLHTTFRTALVAACGFALLAASQSAVQAIPKNYKGNGNHNGWGGGSGAPLPALGATLLGQAVGGAGLYALWRRRQKQRQGKA